MSKIKNYIMDIEEQVMSTDLENIISESEDISEAQSIVVDLLELKSNFDIDIAKTYVAECFNEFHYV
ncbi:MAG TPA: hypothetical protein DCM04_02600 [Saprospirales bacterium]|nr:hypothetical protein [Saprospirales bacterium]|tara:strand:- start:32609 stop:32809 length:201 start_codon:yes stop_codon:yes gene_type:complete